MPTPERRRLRLRTAVSVAAALAVVAFAVVARRFVVGRVVTTTSGVSLGHLPAGTRTADLNVLLITLDTTRADRIGAYGRPDAETPVFDRLARDGVLFRRTLSAAPLTLPAHATIFTGRYPPGHGVRDNGGFVLAGGETTLAERLKAAGFATGGFIGAYVLDRRWGIAQGFDTYYDNFEGPRAPSARLSEVERPANDVADHALRWLAGAASSRFFAWVHFYDAHSPYGPPEPYRSRHPADPYGGEIAFADSQAGRIIDFLTQRDVLKKTIVVVIGDHGESLGEHGERTHGFFVYQSVLQVPLAILAPFDGLHGRTVGALARSVDVVPTILDLLGIPSSGTLNGQSLVPVMTGASAGGQTAAYAEAMYPRYHFGWSELRTLTNGRFAYIDAPKPELYDLDQDPGELTNLYDAQRSLAINMRTALDAMKTASPVAAAPAVDVSPEARARLAALGYVGTFAHDASAPASALADPKDKIELFNLITSAREQLQDAQNSKAGLDMLAEAVRTDPQVIDAWLLMGNEFARRREFARAIDSFSRALALKPDYDLAVMNLANVYRDLGRPNDALAGLTRLVASAPSNVQARQQMAQVLLDLGQLDTAERELNTVLAQDARMAAARNSLGALRLKQGDTTAAEREIRLALAQQADLPLAHFNLALAAEQRGDLETAKTEYLEEIRAHPGSYRAQFNLGKLYEQRGDRPAQLQAFLDSVGSNPAFAEGHLFLAKLYLDLRQLDDAIQSARRGLELQPTGEWAPLGHFVIADALAAQGHQAESAREAAEGRRLAAGSRMRRAG